MKTSTSNIHSKRKTSVFQIKHFQILLTHWKRDLSTISGKFGLIWFFYWSDVLLHADVNSAVASLNLLVHNIFNLYLKFELKSMTILLNYGISWKIRMSRQEYQVDRVMLINNLKVYGLEWSRSDFWRSTRFLYMTSFIPVDHRCPSFLYKLQYRIMYWVRKKMFSQCLVETVIGYWLSE